MLRRHSQKKPPPPHAFTVRLTRSTGSLGLSTTLDTVRVMSVVPGSAAAAAGLQPLDRIVGLNGAPLAGALGEALAAAEGLALELRVERPPASEHARILAEEEARASEALRKSLFDESEGMARLSLSPERQRSFGKALHTITLLRIKDEDPLRGLEVDERNEVREVSLDSTAHRAGLCVGDTIVKLNGRKLVPAEDAEGGGVLSLVEEAKRLGPDVDAVLTIRRGRSFADSVSYTPRKSSAEL
ncbi:hypothetical protein AB1Y20_006085 [Prymnesium parvum]|uniref:PDZ domain-containing protein n=1 Tax=Prymnesium parvum TaxID=97485 RepID=A0AB34J197_PRYPA